jgi:RHS repeat-associated protein
LSNDEVTAQYIYDYGDVRRRKTVTDIGSGATVHTFYIDKFSEIRDGKLLKYVYAGNNRIARSDVAAPDSSFQASTYYLYDHLGSTSIVVSDSAAALEQIVNYPYGHQRKAANVGAEEKIADYRFTGKELDEESGLQYFETRYYSNVTGSFLSHDPLHINNNNGSYRLLTSPQSIHPYCYAFQNPLAFVDKTGLKSESFLDFLIRLFVKYSPKQNTLETGREIEKQGYKYGTGDKKLVCTTYAEKTLKEAGYDVSGNVGKRINIANIKKGEDLGELVRSEDPRTKGVVYALTSSGQGIEIKPTEVQEGDFIQYWYKKGGKLYGHTGQVSKVYKDGRVDLHGSHYSKGGVGTLTRLNLKNKVKVYVVRPIDN